MTTTPATVGEEWIRALPKAEVHLHLEGCVPYEVIAGTAAASGRPPPVPVTDGVPRVASLADLLSYLDWSCALVAEPEQLDEAAYRICARARASGAGHVDVILNPTHWPRWHGRLGAMVDALDAGFRAGEADHGATSALCVSLKRTQSRSEALEVVDRLLELAHPRVVALSIDGNEAGGRESHNDRFAPAFERAAARGLRRCAHAGESSGPDGVREAIELLGAERIDHGIRCIEDPSVTALVASRGIPLDVCPSSNVVLGVVPALAAHPLPELRARGVRCSINTDDPLLYGVDLAGEYRATASAFGWGRAELAEMARVSIEASFADEDRRRELLRQLDAFL
ncbi:MAG TPA: adenosine deaminase [Acidimicrobiales bacterium]|nr:adenosine deaminase [Acidimicrobiales bacterium]